MADHDYRCLWTIGLITGTLRWLEVLVIGIYTFELTGSAFVVSLMLFARTLPGVLCGALTGTVASRFRRKRLLALGMAVGMCNAAILGLLHTAQALSLWWIGAGAAISGIVWTLEHPVRRTLLGDTAAAPLLRHALSLDQFTVNGTRLAGPLAGGIVYAMLGLGGSYLLSAVGFALAMALAFSLQNNPAPARDGGEQFFRMLSDGLRYVRSNRVLRGILLLTIIANFFGFSYVAMIPVIGREVLQLDPARIGLLQSMEGIGALLAAMVLASMTRAVRFARNCTIGGLLFLIMLIPFSVSPWFVLSCAALLTAGIGMGCFGAMQSTTLLNASEPARRMQVMGMLVMCIGAAPAGVLCVGALADWSGPSSALLFMASGGVLSTCVCIWRYPELLR